MSQVNVLKALDEQFLEIFDLCEKIHHELMFMSKLTVQTTTFFGYTIK